MVKSNGISLNGNAVNGSAGAQFARIIIGSTMMNIPLAGAGSNGKPHAVSVTIAGKDIQISDIGGFSKDLAHSSAKAMLQAMVKAAESWENPKERQEIYFNIAELAKSLENKEAMKTNAIMALRIGAENKDEGVWSAGLKYNIGFEWLDRSENAHAVGALNDYIGRLQSQGGNPLASALSSHYFGEPKIAFQEMHMAGC